METVDSFIHLQDAQMAKAFLEGHGISVELPDENSVTAIPGFSTKHGIRLQVNEPDIDMAKELLKEFHKDARASGPQEEDD